MSGAPYWVKIKRDGGYVIFNYSQTESDFSNPVVQECRGIILRERDFVPVCVPFFKFFNANEPNAHAIDWSTARVQEKIDGSIIKVWYDAGAWRVSTNGTIDAAKATLENSMCAYKNFGELFEVARAGVALDFAALDPDCTYMFELVSPFNKTIIYYADIAIFHIGTRNNRTFVEVSAEIGVAKPKTFALNSLEDCTRAAAKLPFNEEGYVVVDANARRVKIKSPEYVRVHRLGNNGVITVARVIEIIRQNEQAEFLTYYPEYTGLIDETRGKIDALIAGLQAQIDALAAQTFETQKDFAAVVSPLSLNAFYFRWYKNRATTPAEWVWGQTNDKIEAFFASAHEPATNICGKGCTN